MKCRNEKYMGKRAENMMKQSNSVHNLVVIMRTLYVDPVRLPAEKEILSQSLWDRQTKNKRGETILLSRDLTRVQTWGRGW